MKDIKQRISIIKQKQQLIKNSGPISPALIKNLGERLRIELTYTSNAIEGNTLSRQETAMVVNDGLSVPGKKLVELLEAKNHDEALVFIQKLSQEIQIHDISEYHIHAIHTIILSNIDNENAGIYRQVPVRISGSLTILPNYVKVPLLMKEMIENIGSSKNDPILLACELHYDFVTIHPFVDGNGRTGRLLFNLVLLIAGYPLCFIKTSERGTYLKALEKAQTGGPKDDYYQVMLGAIERSLDLYLDAIGNIDPQPDNDKRLLKIGQLARETSETVPTIRYRTQLGLLSSSDITDGGYALYDSSMINRVFLIRKLQYEKRMSLEEIKDFLG